MSATPGPWYVHADGETVFSQESHRRVANCTTKCVGVYREERRANARLIAAAQDMRYALKLILQSHDETCKGEECLLSGIDLARAAIAKAEGA